MPSQTPFLLPPLRHLERRHRRRRWRRGASAALRHGTSGSAQRRRLVVPSLMLTSCVRVRAVRVWSWTRGRDEWPRFRLSCRSQPRVSYHCKNPPKHATWPWMNKRASGLPVRPSPSISLPTCPPRPRNTSSCCFLRATGRCNLCSAVLRGSDSSSSLNELDAALVELAQLFAP